MAITKDEIIEAVGNMSVMDLNDLVKAFEEKFGVSAAAMAVAGPANVVGTGKIAGSGGLGGEPGVNPKKKKGPVLITMARRKPTQ